jgi:hypothetical protein
VDNAFDLFKVGRDEAHQVNRLLVSHNMHIARIHGFTAIRTLHDITSLGM